MFPVSRREGKALSEADARARSKQKEKRGQTEFTPASSKEARVRGWLQHMWRKATTDDDWSEGGAGPHEWWDKTTGPPMTSFPRFDLHEASYPLLVLSEKTPAWREVYATILDRLTARYTTHW